jgi:hypothetical protein
VASHFNVYATFHPHSREVCGAICRGTGFPMVPPAPLQAGGVVMYGFLRGLLPTLEAARKDGRPWVYADRGYFRVTQGDDYTGFFRLTRNAFQHDGRGAYEEGASRWSSLSIKLAPWRHGKHILVCPPGDVWTGAMLGQPAKTWLDGTLAILKGATDRPIRVRTKPLPGQGRPLIEDLQDCHALVTHMSNTAVEAVVAGVPVFVTGRCAAAAMGKAKLEDIESPAYPDRAGWVAALAANQWTLDEIRRGKANHLFT